MKNDQLPPNCPMRKADYDHYCPSPTMGPQSYHEHGQCRKQEECSRIVKNFKDMKIPTTSQVIKKMGLI